MGGVLFASDLDNTLLFSHRYRQDTDRCVEYLEGKEQGFFTRRSLELLPLVRQRALFVPVTTRSVAQYRRIMWPESCAPRYAAAANGGILLVDGEEDQAWSARTRELAAPWREELLELLGRLPEAPMLRRCRMVDGLYLFAACDDGESAQAGGRFFAGRTSLDIQVSGRKAYFFPPPLNKGKAVARLKERFQPEKTVCAGDSVIDVPMLRAGDVALLPSGELLGEGGGLRVHSGGGRFPDFVLESVLKEIPPPWPSGGAAANDEEVF